MDIYDFKMMGHSGFENCRIVDSAYYQDNSVEVEGVLFMGDVDDAPECLDNLEITSIDVWYNEKAKRIEATIDVDGYDEEVMEELHAWREEGDGDNEFDGYPSDGSEPQLATDDLEPGQWLE